MELQPTLVGEKLRLDPLREGDFEALYAVAKDPLLWEQHPQRNRYERDVFRAFFDGGLASGGAFLVRDLSGEVIGSSRYYEFSSEKREVTVGYTFLARRCWGGEWNRELKRLMLTHAFRFVDRVLFDVGTENCRSRRALERIGARPMDPPRDMGPGRMSYVLEVGDFAL